MSQSDNFILVLLHIKCCCVAMGAIHQQDIAIALPGIPSDIPSVHVVHVLKVGLCLICILGQWVKFHDQQKRLHEMHKTYYINIYDV